MPFVWAVGACALRGVHPGSGLWVSLWSVLMLYKFIELIVYHVRINRAANIIKRAQEMQNSE